MELTVIEQDVAAGKPGDAHKCAVAQALFRVTEIPFCDICVTPSYIWLGMEQIAIVPDGMEKFILAVDAYRQVVVPVTFNLDFRENRTGT